MCPCPDLSLGSLSSKSVARFASGVALRSEDTYLWGNQRAAYANGFWAVRLPLQYGSRSFYDGRDCITTNDYN